MKVSQKVGLFGRSRKPNFRKPARMMVSRRTRFSTISLHLIASYFSGAPKEAAEKEKKRLRRPGGGFSSDLNGKWGQSTDGRLISLSLNNKEQ